MHSYHWLSMCLVFGGFLVCYAHDHGNNTLRRQKRQSVHHWPEHTVFGPLLNYHTETTLADPIDYPYIGRVVHSTTLKKPYICTAVCIENRIFITAARCLVNAKVDVTTVWYQEDVKLEALAFVLPFGASNQAFDDIGFIIVRKGYKEKEIWPNVTMYHTKSRSDNKYEWYYNYYYWNRKAVFKIVGFACEKGEQSVKGWEASYHLRELNVTHGYSLCREILGYTKKTKGFRVPCVAPCDLTAYRENNRDCHKYLGVLGAAIVHRETTKELLGIATWGTRSHSELELPVGLSIPNSLEYRRDLACAKEIRDYDNSKSLAGLPPCEGGHIRR